MDGNKKVWIGAAVALVVFLGLPIGLQAGRMAGPAPKVEMPKVLDPPLLNADNLPGTVWEVEPQKGIKVVVTMNAGGSAVAVATNPLVRQLVGSSDVVPLNCAPRCFSSAGIAACVGVPLNTMCSRR